MNSQTDSQPLTSNKRFITSIQSRGGLGKSTLSSLLIEWYQYAGVPFKAVDSDSEHHTLKNRYPDNTNLFDARKSMDAFGVMLDRLPDSPVVLVDFPAQFTSHFMEYSTHYRLLDTLERKAFRVTLFIFTSNDEEARRSAADLVEYFGESADYVMIDNPKNFQSDEFKRTGLFKLLCKLQSPLIEMPEISGVSKNFWEDLEEKESKPLSISQVIAHRACSTVAHFELSGIKDLMFRQLEDAAKYLVSDLRLIKGKVTRVGDTKPSHRSSRFNNPLFAKS